nr:rhodanese-like domain-containing protein [Pseudomonadota bacterium]
MAYTTLIDPDTLFAHLDDPRWVVVDCRFNLADTEAGRRAYWQGHIPGARYAHLDTDLAGPRTPDSGRHPLPDPDQLSRTLAQWGIGDATQVVAYDDAGGAMAARLWWLLRWLGHPAAAVLDGGLPAWRRRHLPLTAAPPDSRPATFTPRRDDSLWLDTAAVQA